MIPLRPSFANEYHKHGGRCAISSQAASDALLLKIYDTFLLRNVFLSTFCKTGNQNQEAARTGDQNHVSGAVPRRHGAVAAREEPWQGDCARKTSDRVTKLTGPGKHMCWMVWQELALETFTCSAVLWGHLLVGRCKASSGSFHY